MKSKIKSLSLPMLVALAVFFNPMQASSQEMDMKKNDMKKGDMKMKKGDTKMKMNMLMVT